MYNPLFIYARPGLGKTHLLMGIGHAARAINPRLSVEYLTLDEFIEAFHAAIAAGHGAAYRQRFIDVDLLLVDDVQFLTHRREMQAELLRLTDALQAANRQIVLTSDRPPAEIEALDDRLIRRFAGGLVIDVVGARLRDPGRDPAPQGRGAAGVVRRRGARRGGDARDRQRARAAGRAQPAHRLPVGERRAAHAGSRRGGWSGERRAVPARRPRIRDPQPAAPDEFGDFLSEITATVTQQVDAWRTKVGAAILRWEGEGFRTTRLEQLLEQEMVTDPEAAIRAFEADIARLQEMQAEAAEIAPELAGSVAFKDPGDLAAAEAALQRAREGTHPPPSPSPLWTHGRSRRVGVATAWRSRRPGRSAAAPGVRYNPLVIVGAGGVGKTHLLHAIGNVLAGGRRAGGLPSAPEFTSELIEAIDRDAVPAWRARYRRAAAFLLDDVHLAAETDRTQDELFVLFNQFAESGRQMIFTSAVPIGLAGAARGPAADPARRGARGRAACARPRHPRAGDRARSGRPPGRARPGAGHLSRIAPRRIGARRAGAGAAGAGDRGGAAGRAHARRSRARCSRDSPRAPAAAPTRAGRARAASSRPRRAGPGAGRR